jgi:putative transposase
LIYVKAETIFQENAFERGSDGCEIRIRYRDRGRIHQGGVVERQLGKLNGVLATCPRLSGAMARRNSAIGVHRGDETVRDRH